MRPGVVSLLSLLNDAFGGETIGYTHLQIELIYHPALPSSSTIQLSRCNSNETGRSKREVFSTEEENDFFLKMKRNH